MQHFAGSRRVVMLKRRWPQRDMRCGNIRPDESNSKSRSFSFSMRWRFQEFAPTVGARDGGCWAVTGFSVGGGCGSTGSSEGTRGPRLCVSH